MILKEVHYYQIYISSVPHRWEFKQKLPHMKRESSSKRARKTVDRLPKDFTAVSLDESFFFFDSFIRSVWIYMDSKPVVTKTRSHRNLSMFGPISLKGKQLFRIFKEFNEDTFYEFLK